MDYHSEAGNNLIEEWYLNQHAQVQADFDATLKFLSIRPDWRQVNEFKMLGKRYPGLGEIRFKTNNVQYRVAGRFGPGEKTFTLLVGCYKKQKVYEPPCAFDLALKRASLLDQRKGFLRERVV